MSHNQEAGSKRKTNPTDAVDHPEKNPRMTSTNSEPGSSAEDDEEARKLEEKRAYNRRNAARARQRTKEHILELTARAERFAARNEDLQRTNDTLMAEVKLLREENQRLRQLVGATGATGGGTSVVAGATAAGTSAMLPGAGSALMDQSALHAPAPTATIIFPHGERTGTSQMSSNDAAVAAARQRGLLLQLLQGQQGVPDPRQGLPPGYNF